MTRVPVDPEYFIGIGGSPDTGDRQGDLEGARAKALAQLAAEIEVTVRSDQTFREAQSAEGSSTTTAEIIVRTLTSANLEGVELVDTYHSTREGYWFYFRLSKKSWDLLKNRDLYALRDRILAMLEEAANGSIADRLRALGSASALLRGSAYAGRIVVQAGGATGVLDDVIAGRLRDTLSRMTVRVVPTAIQHSPGRPVELRVQVSSTERGSPGVLPLEIRGPDGSLLGQLKTGTDGSYAGLLQVAALKTGRRQCTVVLSPEALRGADPSVLSLARGASLSIEVLPLGVYVGLAGPDNLDARWLRESLDAILMQRSALAVLPEAGASPFRISFTVGSRNAPKNEYGIEIAYCALSMAISRGDSQIAAFTSPESKGAGNSPEQAVRNAAKALLEALAKDPGFGEALAVLVASAWSGQPE